MRFAEWRPYILVRSNVSKSIALKISSVHPFERRIRKGCESVSDILRDLTA